jgi:hypothetical protein
MVAMAIWSAATEAHEHEHNCTEAKGHKWRTNSINSCAILTFGRGHRSSYSDMKPLRSGEHMQRLLLQADYSTIGNTVARPRSASPPWTSSPLTRRLPKMSRRFIQVGKQALGVDTGLVNTRKASAGLTGVVLIMEFCAMACRRPRPKVYAA